jgi:hypothetical protein
MIQSLKSFNKQDSQDSGGKNHRPNRNINYVTTPTTPKQRNNNATATEQQRHSHGTTMPQQRNNNATTTEWNNKSE